MEATVSCRGPAPPSRTSTRVPSTPAHSGCSSIAVAPCSREWLGDPAPGLNGGGGIRTLGPPCDGQRFSRRAETTAMPHHNWSLRPGGIQGGMNLARRLCYPSAAERDSAARMGKRRSADWWAALLQVVQGGHLERRSARSRDRTGARVLKSSTWATPGSLRPRPGGQIAICSRPSGRRLRAADPPGRWAASPGRSSSRTPARARCFRPPRALDARRQV
jgi:hypothetical protein